MSICAFFWKRNAATLASRFRSLCGSLEIGSLEMDANRNIDEGRVSKLLRAENGCGQCDRMLSVFGYRNVRTA